VTRASTLVAALVAAALVGAGDGGAVQAQTPKLFGSVGPDFEISLVDAQGNRVTSVDPGTYEVEVRDRSDFHTFHLEGPGVDERTEVAFTGTVTWTVTFRDGRYRFYCDPHPTLAGAFTAGTPATTTPATTPPGTVTAKSKLVLTAGPSFSITLKTSAGKAVKRMRLGTYSVTVRDRSRIHNAHVVAPGFNKATTVPFVGTKSWKFALKRTGTFRFLCDPHASSGMRGSAKIVP
jgi:plastocyanin